MTTTATVRPFSMRFLPTYIAALGTMVALDAFWLNFSVDLFQEALGAYLLPTPRIPVVVVFYLGYVALIVAFGVDRAGGTIAAAARRSAGLGLIGYGTYEFTNWSTVAAWTPKLVLFDTLWGMFVTACVAAMAQFVFSKR
jgi:uncharacterized membrane protein